MGWLDLVLLKYAIEINGVTELFLTKLDILSGLDEILVCTKYITGGSEVLPMDFSPAAEDMQRYEPFYESLPGWKEDLCSLRRWNDLPIQAKEYVEFIEAYCGISVAIISVGSERSAVITRS